MDRGLRQLEELRRARAERARLELTSAQGEERASAAAQRAQRTAELRCERALADARMSFAQAATVGALQTCTGLLRLAEAELLHCRERGARAQRAHALAVQRVRACQAALNEAERERLAVARVLERRAQDVSSRTEKRYEDEADDAFRGRVAH